MARVFVSHATPDGPLASELHKWLVASGHKVFLDLDLLDGVSIGEEWEQRLFRALRWADCVVCLVSADFRQSPWCAAEVGAARAHGSRVLPLLVGTALRHPLLASLQHLDYSASPSRAKEALLDILATVDATGGVGWPDDASPYPGLRPFDTTEHSMFFGRRSETAACAASLRSFSAQTARAVLVIVGPSGCGKSSLVRAGLLPVMAAESGWWTVPAITPGPDPVSAMAREFAAASRDLRIGWTVEHLRDRLSCAQGLLEISDELLAQAPAPRRRHLLIVIDQFEELFTLCGQASRTWIAEQLRAVLVGGSAHVVATIRPEYLNELLSCQEFSEVPCTTSPIRPMSRDVLPEVIECPARRAGIQVEAELTRRLVADTGSGEAMPLLAFTLAQLSAGLRRGDSLSLARYEDIGGVRGALIRQAESALQEATDRAGLDREEVLSGLLRMVTMDDRGNPARSPALRADFDPLIADAMEAFVRRRLVAISSETGEVTLCVAHEAFLTAWRPLAHAISATSAAIRMRRTIEEAAAQWDEAGRPVAQLWEHGRVVAAIQALPRQRRTHQLPYRRRQPAHDERATIELSARASEFLRVSFRRDRRRRAVVAVAGGTLAGAILVAGTWVAAPVVEEYRLRAQAEELSRTADLSAGVAVLGPRDRPRRVYVGRLRFDVHEVTHAQYALCVKARRCSSASESYDQRLRSARNPGLPVVNVDAYQSAQYCSWLRRRLPTADEWERAARGLDGYLYPWGDRPPSPRHVRAAVGGVTPTTSVSVDEPGYEAGQSRDGHIRHMIGNVAEWVATPLDENGGRIPGRNAWDGRSAVEYLSVKGGFYESIPPLPHMDAPQDPSFGDQVFGFRCVDAPD